MTLQTNTIQLCLAPFFVGRAELGLDASPAAYDFIISTDIIRGIADINTCMVNVNARIRDFVASSIHDGASPVVVCGDCLSAIGCLAGLEQQGIRPNLLWFDAHGDFHTPETTISGHFGGMPLAMITGRGDCSLLKAIGLTPYPDNSVCLIGGRDLERGELENLEASGVKRCQRITEVMQSLSDDQDYWMHFDTDYINPSDAPAMRYPAKGGPRASEISRDLSELVTSKRVLGMSVSAWAPHMDANGNTAKVCWEVISAVTHCLSNAGYDSQESGRTTTSLRFFL